MPRVDERYNQLSVVTRAWLATLDDEEIVRLENLTRLYSRMQTRPWVLAWLEGVREDEIELLDDGIRLIRAGTAVGKFAWWVIASVLATAILLTQAGDFIKGIYKGFRGG